MNESLSENDVFNNAEQLVSSRSEQFDVDVENCNPIQILVFPPKNKKFRYDEKTEVLQLEPLELNPPQNQNVTIETYNATCDTQCSMPEESNGTNTVEMEAGSKVIEKPHVKEIMKVEKVFSGKNCFLKGCKWSPDGLCLLSNSEDNVLRMFEILENVANEGSDEIQPFLTVKEGGTIYDFEWYSRMDSSDPVSCVFASSSQNSPIHLWDAYTGSLRATYQPINQYDEVTAAYSLAFSPDGCKIYSGFKKVIRIFDVAVPGRVSEERNVKPKGDLVYQTNIISSIAINPVEPNIYALGSYDRTIGIYTEPRGDLQCLIKGHRGGITEIKFSNDGVRLYSGGRKDNEIICWDLRQPGSILCILKREVNTNQRIYFDLSNDGCYLVTGSTDGRIILYDTGVISEGKEVKLEPFMEWMGHGDCVNGVDFHPSRPLLASTSGQYHQTISDMDDSDFSSESRIENSLKLWTFNLKNEKQII